MTASPRSRRRLRPAFTLVEAMTTIVILAAIGSVASTAILSSADGFLEAHTTAQIHTELSVALDRAVRELRRVELDVTTVGLAPDIDSFAAGDIQWQTPLCRLWLSGSTLYLQIDGGSSGVLLKDVTGFTITAYDESNAVVAAPKSGTGCDPIRRLKLEVTVTRHGISETQRTKVFLRCTVSGA